MYDYQKVTYKVLIKSIEQELILALVKIVIIGIKQAKQVT